MARYTEVKMTIKDEPRLISLRKMFGVKTHLNLINLALSILDDYREKSLKGKKLCYLDEENNTFEEVNILKTADIFGDEKIREIRTYAFIKFIIVFFMVIGILATTNLIYHFLKSL